MHNVYKVKNDDANNAFLLLKKKQNLASRGSIMGNLGNNFRSKLPAILYIAHTLMV